MPADDFVDGPLDFILEWFRRFEEWCPGIVGRVLEFLVDIPEGDERAMFRLGEAYEEAAKALSEHLREVAALSPAVAEAWSGDGAAAAFQHNYGAYLEQVSNSVVGLYDMREMAQSAGVQIETAKFMAAINLYMLASALVAIASTLIVSFGTSTFAAPAAEAAAQTGIRAAVQKLLAQLMGRKFAGSIGKFAEIAGKKVVTTAGNQGGRRALGQAVWTGAKNFATKEGQKAFWKGLWGGLRTGASKLTPKQLANRLAARNAAERAGAQFAERAGLQTGKLRTAWEVATLKGGERLAGRAVQQAVKRDMYRKVLAETQKQTFREVFKQGTQGMGKAALMRGKGFAMFNVKTTLGIHVIQMMEVMLPSAP